MRNATDFVEDYRRKGYPDDRIRIIASMRPEPLRSEALAILDAGIQSSAAPAAAPPPVQESAEPAAETAPSIEANDAVATPAAAAQEPAPAAREPDEPSAPAPTPDADALKALKQEAAAARNERNKVAAELKKAGADLSRARADLARLLTTNAEIPALRDRLEHLKTALAEKEKLLLEKERALEEKETALAAERSEREAAVARAEKLSETVEGQSRRLTELDALQGRMTGANQELDQLRTASEQLKENVEAKVSHIGQLQADLTQTHNEATLLREQIESNGNAIGQLQEKLTSREAELESLRSHFDREAADLKKRAEQEMWVVRRSLRRVHRMAALGGAAAACLVLVMGFNILGKSRNITNLKAQLDAAPAVRSSLATADAGRTTPPAPHAVNAVQPLPPRPADAPRPVALVVPTVSEPSRDGATPPAAAAGRAPKPPEPVAVGPGPAAPPTLSMGSRVVTYTVKMGDTLGDISRRILGDPAKWPAIAKENGIKGTDIREGKELHITVASSN